MKFTPNVSYIKGNKELMTTFEHYCPYCGGARRAKVLKYWEEPFDPRERDRSESDG